MIPVFPRGPADFPKTLADTFRAEEVASDRSYGHPLYDVFVTAIEQARTGKGTRHGGDIVPFMTQPWVHYAKMHGRGFLTGQAAKKLEEAASTREGEAFLDEMRGALVYIGMAILHEQAKMEAEKAMHVAEKRVPSRQPRPFSGAAETPFPPIQPAPGVEPYSR